MSKSRRTFLKNAGGLAGFSLAGPATIIQQNNPTQGNYVRDLGMRLCLAYFWGVEPRKTALARQMDVLGAVGGINPTMAGLSTEKPWSREVIKGVKEVWKKEGLTLRVIEGPPSLGTKTKLGLPGKDEEISNFITLLKNLSLEGIDTVCYNWMPVISWARTVLDRPGRGGALVSGFDIEDVRDKEPIRDYGNLTPELMWNNLQYFLDAVVPEAEKYQIKLALHPDDPPVAHIQGIPRIMTSVDAFKRLLTMAPSPFNGITFCQGSFASMGEKANEVDIPAAIRYFGQKQVIHFVHFRDVKGNKNNFEETFHDEGKTDMFASMRALHDIGFTGPIRPDHVPTMAGDSNEKPGYSTIGTLYAIGYIRGLMEGVGKSSE
ncbi:mannonate dehydratase [Cyclobacterium jeungdonense]|uniref:mannonate dehydratase n=1 Tax=Cyclobacterium jeungdonense TaxID=708087 RepID=A0ABT8CF31_9BACT|nr:mannonate dehydratase [Cyclobacterium jeungdonense]MDN3690393.1 mannonate dehydratase [Cyclobacterium jeungdonense]